MFCAPAPYTYTVCIAAGAATTHVSVRPGFIHGNSEGIRGNRDWGEDINKPSGAIGDGGKRVHLVGARVLRDLEIPILRRQS